MVRSDARVNMSDRVLWTHLGRWEPSKQPHAQKMQSDLERMGSTDVTSCGDQDAAGIMDGRYHIIGRRVMTTYI